MDRQNPHAQRLRPAPIGRSVIAMTPEARRLPPPTTKTAPITFPSDIQQVIMIGRSISKYTDQRIQLQLYRAPDTKIEIVTLSDSEVDDILKQPPPPPPEIERAQTPQTQLDSNDFSDFYEDFFDSILS